MACAAIHPSPLYFSTIDKPSAANLDSCWIRQFTPYSFERFLGGVYNPIKVSNFSCRQVAGSAVEGDSAVAQANDTVEVAKGKLECMHTRDQRLAFLFAEVAQQVHYLAAALRVEAGYW